MHSPAFPKFSRARLTAMMCAIAMTAGGCAQTFDPSVHRSTMVGPPVTNNTTPYSACLARLGEANTQRKPTFAVGHISDKTGRLAYDQVNNSAELTQGVSEMMISAFYRTGQVRLTERLDPRIALTEQQLVQQNLITQHGVHATVAPANFVVLGALTELNYNIMSGGNRLYVAGIGGSRRTAMINVGLDVRVVDMHSFETIYVTSLQKQIIGTEYEAGVFRFFGNQFVEFDSGRVKNEPLQLGVRSVVELAVYQILTEGLGLPAGSDAQCQPGSTETTSALGQIF